MNYPVYKKSNEDIYKDYVDPNRRDFQNLNCHTLINRLNNGDMSALSILRKIEVLGIISNSIYLHPKSILEIISLHSRSNENIYSDYENTKSEKLKSRDCKILIYRSLEGDKDALEKLKLVALDETIGSLSSRQANNALDEMNNQ